MRKIRFIILALLVLCIALIFASCDLAGGTVTPDGTSADSTGGTTETSDGTASEPLTESDGAKILEAQDFVISGTTLSAAVSNATETFSFINRVTVSPKATWQISTDLQGKEVIPTKTVPLNVGDNVFYILVTSGDGESLSLYTVTVRRKPMYTVSFETNCGTEYAPLKIEEGEAAVLPTEDPVRAGYTFDGWDNDLSAPLTDDLTVNAEWTAIEYTITYDLAGGTGAEEYPSVYTVEDEIFLAAPTRTGYTFDGWSDGGIIAAGSTGTKTFVANWTAINYRISYNLNGGTNNGNNPTTYTVEDTVVFAVPTRAGYEFVGWITPDGQWIERLSDSSGSVTLSAEWRLENPGTPPAVDKWEIIAPKITSIAERDRTLRIELDAYASAEKIAKNDRYLAGPDSIEEGITPAIEAMVYERNRAADELLGTTTQFVFWDYGWGQQQPPIDLVVKGNAADAPDLFVNMLYDLNLELLNGTFKDIWSIPSSYFDFETDGWLTAWMESLSFNGDRAYVLGGDYFFDLIRSTLVMPFNVTMMDANANKLATAIIGKYETLGEGEELSARFFDLVDEGKWTWDVLGKLCEAIWVDIDGDAMDSIADVLGIVADGYGASASTAFLYSAGSTYTETYLNENEQKWIRYSEESSALCEIFDSVAAVFTGQGSLVTRGYMTGATPDNPGLAYHNVKFAENTLLFAGPRMLGALEGDTFQMMDSIYSVIPMPKVSADKEYNSLIHNVGDAGAINVNVNPRKARVLSAYLQFCTENSGEILNEYFELVMKYKVTTYNQGTDRMLDLIYNGIVDGRDKTIEDAWMSDSRFHTIMRDHGFTWGSADVVSWYESVRASKQAKLDQVLSGWYTLPKTDGVEAPPHSNPHGSSGVPVHTHVPEKYYTVDVLPSCSAGSKSYHCAVCGQILSDTVVTLPAKYDEHVWADEYTVDVEPSCFAEGSESIHCTLCGERKPDTSVTLPAIGHHTWSDEYTVEVAPTCTTEGVKAYYCTVCGDRDPASVTAVGTGPHTPEEVYTVDVDPTCSTVGYKSKHCAVCGEIIAATVVEIPIVSDAHVVNEWTIVEPTMFEPVGSKSGVCTVCEEPLNFVLNWELTTYSSVESTGKYIEGVEFATNKTVEEIRGDKSFAPTEDDPDGNDLWFEYSLLYNKTLYNHDYPNSLSEIRLFCFRESTNRSVYRGFYYLYLRDNGDGFKTSTDCPYRGHIDYSTYDVDATPPENCAYDLTDLGNTLNGRTIGRFKAGWDAKRTESPYLWDVEWQTLNGWHRLGFRYHQDAAINEGTVVYSGYTELYIDGVLCWKIDSNFKPGHKDSLVTKNLLLWTAEIDNTDPENPKLVYTNHDSMMVGMRMDNFKQASQEVLMAIDDVRWTCGDGFAVPVKRVENPKPVPTTLKEGVDDVIAVYYAKPDCVHEAEDEWVVVKEATVAEPGLKAKYCAKCGERMETEELEYVPYVYNPADLDSYTFNNDKGMLLITKTLPEIAGEDHFYPTDVTPAGKALYYEFAILYNETMAHSATEEYDLCLNYQGVGGKTLFCFVTKDNANSWCKYAGGFDYSNKKAILYGPEGGDSQPKENYPNLGNYGWHMIGVKFYQTAALDGDNVVYSGVSTLYIDGNKVWEIDVDMSKLVLSGDKTLRLFDATNNAGVLEYADNPNAAKVRMQLRGEGINGSTAPFYFIFGDVSWNIVAADFTPNVKPVADPAAATYKINDDLTVPAAVYFEAK